MKTTHKSAFPGQGSDALRRLKAIFKAVWVHLLNLSPALSKRWLLTSDSFAVFLFFFSCLLPLSWPAAGDVGVRVLNHSHSEEKQFQLVLGEGKISFSFLTVFIAQAGHMPTLLSPVSSALSSPISDSLFGGLVLPVAKDGC